MLFWVLVEVLHTQLHYLCFMIIVLLPCGSMRKQPAPAPSLFLEPSKYKVHMFGSVSSKVKSHGIETIFELLLVSTFVQSSNIVQWGSSVWVIWRSSDYSFESAYVEVSSSNSPRNVSKQKFPRMEWLNIIGSFVSLRSVTICFIYLSRSTFILFGWPLNGNHKWD